MFSMSKIGKYVAIMGLLLAVLVLASIAPAHALLIQEPSRLTLSGNDFIDWGVLGAPYTTVPSGKGALSNSGNVTGTVSQPGSADLERVDEGTGWTGIFAIGDHLLWNQDNTNEIDIAFSTPVKGVGAQIQSDSSTAFHATLNVFDASNTSLGSFFVLGNNDRSELNTAPFLGVLSDSFNIDHIQYIIGPLDTGNPFGAAINQLDLVDAATAVPEPATLLLLGSGLAGLAAWRRRRHA